MSMFAFPSTTQGLLIRALLAPDDQFSLLWNQWKAVAGRYDDLDYGSARLFPFAYRKLLRLLPEDTWITVCKNAYQTSWLKNSLLLNEAEQVMDVLDSNGIPFMLLKGAAFISLYYGNDIGARSIDDVDMMIPADRFSEAIDLICKRYPAYRTHTAIELFQPDFFHEMSLYTSSGILDMHCHLLHGYLQDGDWAMLAEGTQRISIQNRKAMTLSSSYHVVHVCAHALGWNGKDGVQLKWILDAVFIIRSGQVDWRFVVDLSQRMRTTLSVGVALRYLSEQSFVDIPEWVLDQLQNTPVSLPDRRMTYLESKDTYTRIIPAIELYWWRYVKSLSRPYTIKNGMKQAGRFLKFLCQTPSLMAVPAIVALRFSQLVGRFCRLFLGIDLSF